MAPSLVLLSLNVRLGILQNMRRFALQFLEAFHFELSNALSLHEFHRLCSLCVQLLSVFFSSVLDEFVKKLESMLVFFFLGIYLHELGRRLDIFVT